MALGLPIAWIDLRTHRIPNRLSATLLAGLVTSSWLTRQPLTAPAMIAIELTGVLALLRLISKGGVGMGDIKLAPSIGWVAFRAPISATLLVAGLSALALGRVAGLRGGRAPFAPFLVLAGLVGTLGWPT